MKSRILVMAVAIAALALPAAAMADSGDVTVRITGPAKARVGQVVTYRMYIRNASDQTAHGAVKLIARLDWKSSSHRRDLVPQIQHSSVKFSKLVGLVGGGPAWRFNIPAGYTQPYTFTVRLGVGISYQLRAEVASYPGGTISAGSLPVTSIVS